jgi:hypothetical protein
MPVFSRGVHLMKLSVSRVGGNHEAKKDKYGTSLNLGACILLRVFDQVQGLPSNATLFQ